MMDRGEGEYKMVEETNKLWAFENFFYTMSGVGFIPNDGKPHKVHVKDYKSVAKMICSLDWDDLDGQYPKDDQPKEFNGDWCFSATYAYIFLTKGLGLHPDYEIMVGNSIDSHGIDWALGAVLQHH